MTEYDPDTELLKKMEPLIRRILREELQMSKIIVGATAIKKVLGIKSTKALMGYYNKSGLPMVKGKRGYWQIHSDSIKDWMQTRSLMGRKAKELGIQFTNRDRSSRYPRLERLTEQEMARVIAAIREDNAR